MSEETPSPDRPVVRWDQIRIAKSCPADWGAMTGDDRRRFCGTCSKNVFHLADLARKDAEQIILSHEGRLCVRLYQRPDGTLTTGDCIRVTLPRRRRRGAIATVAAAIIGLSSVAIAGSVVSSITPETELADQGTFARRIQDKILDLRVSLGIDPEPVQFGMGEIDVNWRGSGATGTGPGCEEPE